MHNTEPKNKISHQDLGPENHAFYISQPNGTTAKRIRYYECVHFPRGGLNYRVSASDRSNNYYLSGRVAFLFEHGELFVNDVGQEMSIE